MPPSWKLFDVTKFQEDVKAAQNTVDTRAVRSTGDDPDDDSQQSPDFVDARPRADSSSVARCSECRPRADRSAVARFFVADLEPASLRERESVKSSKGRQPMNRCQTCLKHENGKRAKGSTRPRQSPPTARYKARSAKTAAFSRKTMHRKGKREGALKRRHHSAERPSSATSKKER